MNAAGAGAAADGILLPALLEAALASGTEVRFEVDGRSMLPLIRPGDTVRVRPTGAASPRIGDVVAIRRAPNGSLLVHRVVAVHDGSVEVWGDNTTVSNGRFSVADVLGVVIVVEREGREVWFGAGRWGRLVALAVRGRCVRRFNRVAALKYALHSTRIRGHKGDDGNE